MKDETGGAKITEFVGLRPKMYSYIVQGDPKPDSHHRAKGVKSATSKKLKHQDYLAQLQLPSENRLINRRIAHKLHQVHSIEFAKRCLCAFDDKRFLLEDGALLIDKYYMYYCMCAIDISLTLHHFIFFQVCTH